MSILQQFTELRDYTYHRSYYSKHHTADYEIVCTDRSLFVHKYVLLGTDFIEKYGVQVDDKKMTVAHKWCYMVPILDQLYGYVDNRLDYKPLFDRTDISDFKFVCTDGEIPAHKMVLMDKCRFFADYIKDTGEKSMKMDHPICDVLPIIRLIYGFVHDVKHKYNLLPVAHLFQLNGSIEKYIIPELQHKSPEMTLCRLSTLDDNTIKYVKDVVVKWMLKHISIDEIVHKVKHIAAITQLCSVPLSILKAYLDSDFLRVTNETHTY